MCAYVNAKLIAILRVVRLRNSVMQVHLLLLFSAAFTIAGSQLATRGNMSSVDLRFRNIVLNAFEAHRGQRVQESR